MGGRRERPSALRVLRTSENPEISFAMFRFTAVGKGMVRFVGGRCIIGVSWDHRRRFAKHRDECVVGFSTGIRGLRMRPSPLDFGNFA